MGRFGSRPMADCYFVIIQGIGNGLSQASSIKVFGYGVFETVFNPSSQRFSKIDVPAGNLNLHVGSFLFSRHPDNLILQHDTGIWQEQGRANEPSGEKSQPPCPSRPLMLVSHNPDSTQIFW